MPRMPETTFSRPMAERGRVRFAGAVERLPVARVRARAKMVRIYGTPWTAKVLLTTGLSITAASRWRPTITKYYTPDGYGTPHLEAERRSVEVFGDRQWRLPVERWTANSFTVHRFRPEQRLDVAGESMTAAQRLDISVRALDILLEIYLEGYMHGDFTPSNLWFVEDSLLVTDWENFAARDDEPFVESTEIRGLEHPTEPGTRICASFAPEDPYSFASCFGISLEQVLQEYRRRAAAAPGRFAALEEKLAALDGHR